MKRLIFLLSFFSLSLSFIHIKDTKDFKIALYQENIHQLEKYVLEVSDPDSPNYLNWLTQEGILEIISPKYSEVKPLLNWLDQSDLQCQHYGDVIFCRGPISEINKMFRTELKFNRNNKSWHSDVEYQIPYKFQHLIQFIDGLNHPFMKSSKGLKLSDNYNPIPDSGYVSREVIQRVYNFNLNATKNNSIGVIEYTDFEGFSASDLSMSQRGNDLAQNPVEYVVGTDHSQAPDLESELDIQFISQVAAGAELWYWDTSRWLYKFAVEFFNRDEIPSVISMSWGWSEIDQCAIAKCGNITSEEYIQRVNNEYLKITARGTTICVAAGDAGAPGRVNEMCLNDESTRPINPVFPGSSPWVTSVGATFLLQDNNHWDYHTPVCQELGCANGTKEYPTTFAYVRWTTGGGFDDFNPTPDWQKSAVQKYLNSSVQFPNKDYWNSEGRGYPDVAAIGHNCAVYSNYSGWIGVDGTSCSSPLFAGIVATLNQYLLDNNKSTLGFINPLLYKMAEDSETFQDITHGNNSCTEAACCHEQYGYQATQGWDPVSGLGTPNVEKIVKYLDNLFI